MSRAPRVGLTQRVDDLAERGERRDALDQAWAVGLARLGMIAIPVPNAAHDAVDVGDFVDAMQLDLVILTGGNDIASLPGAVNAAPERDSVERALLAAARERALPVLGVCRGMQMMIVEGGGALERTTGHVRTVHALTTTPGDSLPLRDGRAVNSFHDWAATADGLPHGFIAVATAPDGTVEAMHHVELPHVAIMWHPERADPTRGTPWIDDDLALVRRMLETRGRS